MSFEIYDMTVPVFVAGLTNMRDWLDKVAGEQDQAALFAARLAPDMKPFSAQYQLASDSAKGALARLTGGTAPAMADDETSFADLRARCEKTIAYVGGFDRAALAGAAERACVIRFPGGQGYRWSGAEYVAKFALPNFFFHVTTAYAILRHAGVAMGKPDYLRHLGMPLSAEELG